VTATVHQLDRAAHHVDCRCADCDADRAADRLESRLRPLLEPRTGHRVLNQQQAADYLGCTTDHVRELARSGRLRHVPDKNFWRTTEAWCDQFLADASQGGASA
jgi:excisionase family DNA binding protein